MVLYPWVGLLTIVYGIRPLVYAVKWSIRVLEEPDDELNAN